MAARKKTRQREAQLAFEAIFIEGGLLSPDWLARAAQLGAGGQSESDYRIPKGLNLRDEIGRYWRIAQAHWSDFAAGRTGGAAPGALAECFVQALLRDSFGFASLSPVSPLVVAEHSYPIGFSALGERVPVVIAPAGSGLDALSPAFGDDGRRRSAFGLAQEFLNAADGALWGLATDGVALRIVRDNASLTRPAWIEVDLVRIFTEERYADFAALWLLVHETRFGRPEQPVTECALESWRNAGREEGTRAREHLRRGVEDALIALGQGFLAHSDNQALRAALQSGTLSTKDYFNQLLRLVYRLIFMLTVEERGVLHPDGADDVAKVLYGEGYSLKRLRERSVKRSAHDRFADLWEATKIVFRGAETGETRLGLPALGGIFAKAQCPALDAAKLENRALLLAVFKLSWLRENSGLSRVNWRDMGPEELGSVYESLLELVPQITQDGRQFTFATGGETKGNARKTTGSYYTPDSLVQVLLDSALEPVVKDTLAKYPDKPVEALLGLSIVDPACGSGHFLLAAARRLAAHVARLSANGTPSAAEYRHALRQVVGRCIYGVDLNPLAVELCKVSLWMEAVEPGLPLTFLNSHIQYGNALLGTTPELMAMGIPDAAWEPIAGDNKTTASALKKRNKKGAEGQRSLDTLWSKRSDGEAQVVARAVAALEETSDANPAALAKKESQWDGILGSPEYRHQKLIADAWCAAFVWPKEPGDFANAAPTNELWRQLRDGQGQPPALTVSTANELAEQYGFFHWNLAFPSVFARGGFDVVLGNPPWDQIQLDAREWFATREPSIANAQHHSARRTALSALETSNPTLHRDFLAAQRQNEGIQACVHQSGRYPLGSQGRLNTSTLFVEAACKAVQERGYISLIVPTGIATDSFTQEFFRYLVSSERLHHLLAFENEEHIFPAVHNAARFCLLKIGGASVRAPLIQLVFYARQVAEVRDPTRIVTLQRTDFRLLNPNTATCPTFRSKRDADLNRNIYKRLGVLVDEHSEDGNPWAFRGLIMFMMNTDSHRFGTRTQMESSGRHLVQNTFSGPDGSYLPLIEGKMVYPFDHRFGTYDGATQAHLNKGFLPQLDDAAHSDCTHTTLPEYWVSSGDVDERIGDRWPHRWLLGWRDITGVEKQRTVVPCLIPRVAAGDTFLLAMPAVDSRLVAGLYANLSSFVLDYAARQKVGGTHLKYHVFKQLPVLRPQAFGIETPWDSSLRLQEWLLARVLELTYTAWDLEPFASDVGYDGPPFRWDPERRFLLRCELDAAFFHLYGLSCDDADYVMGTFPIVRKKEEKAHGEYRTKRVVLEVYDAMADAARTGTPYQTRLDPPPADPRVAHPDTRAKGADRNGKS
jgi:N-6 DNA Methylase